MRTEIEETRAATAAMQAATSRADAMLNKLAEQITPIVSHWQPRLRSCLLQHSSGQHVLYRFVSSSLCLCPGLECLNLQLSTPLKE